MWYCLIAKMLKRNNDTPVQSQSERDKTVAGNEGSYEKSSQGLESRDAYQKQFAVFPTLTRVSI